MLCIQDTNLPPPPCPLPPQMGQLYVSSHDLPQLLQQLLDETNDSMAAEQPHTAARAKPLPAGARQHGSTPPASAWHQSAGEQQQQAVAERQQYRSALQALLQQLPSLMPHLPEAIAVSVDGLLVDLRDPHNAHVQCGVRAWREGRIHEWQDMCKSLGRCGLQSSCTSSFYISICSLLIALCTITVSRSAVPLTCSLYQ